jgi:Domain of unknown function (DUF4388)
MPVNESNPVELNLEPTPFFAGRIGDLGGATQLLLYLATSKKTGVLRMGTSSLHLDAGNLTHATHPGMQGIQAALAVLEIDSGDFLFTKEQITRTFELDAARLAFEMARQQDERARKNG